MSKETIMSVVIKHFGKAYCPTCNADIHGMGQIDNCPQCGQAVKWRDDVTIDMCAMEEFESNGKKKILGYFGVDLATGEDFSVRSIKRNGKWEVE